MPLLFRIGRNIMISIRQQRGDTVTERIFKKNEIQENGFMMTKMVLAGSGKAMSTHWHNYFEVIRCINGRICVLMDGSKMWLEDGDCVLITPGCSHDMGLNADEAKVQIIQFYLPESVNSSLGVDSSMSLLLYSNYKYNGGKIIRSKDPFSRQASFLCDELYRGCDSGEMISDDIIKGAIQMLLGYFTCETAFHACKDYEDEGLDMVKLCKYIDSHPLTEQDLTLISAYMGYSKAYFSRRFKEVTGIGFKQYMDQLKMHEARRMLGEGQSVTQTAIALGYSSVQNFSRTFRRIHQMSPSEMMRYQR